MKKMSDKQGLSPDAVIDRLKAKGISATRQRVQIAELLFAKPQHLSADQVLERVNREDSTASKATIYNTLNLFARKGLVREVIVDPSKVFYDSNTSEHHHVYNLDSGVLTDIEFTSINMAELPPLPTGTTPVTVDLIIRVRESS
ncbi:MAG: transcriptional repressor [Gammaproteobacteria bacterium]|nr:transcriptional repressor [Gammaproteobacteria bacterium]